jgi:adenine phosphoribosyltransferase
MVEKCHKLTFVVQIGADILAACFIIDLPDLGGAEKIRKLGVPVRTLVSFEGH